MLISVKEASAILSLSPCHIRKMIAKGCFPAYRMGNRILRLDLDEVKAASRLTLSTPIDKEHLTVDD